MGFVKTKEELELFSIYKLMFYDVENIAMFWETTPDVVKRLLPPPLEPADFPLVYAFVANYPKTNISLSYKEAALFLACKFNGEIGFHCIAMPVTEDMAMASGRESFGYPKKMAQISFNCVNGVVEGWVERHGIRFFQAKAKLTGKPNASDALAIIGKYLQPPIKFFLFKHFRAPDRFDGKIKLDYNPRLVRIESSPNRKKLEIGEVEITMTHSNYDPWTEVKVVRPLIGMHMVYDATLGLGKVVAEVDPEEFLPYAFFKDDPIVQTNMEEPIKPQIKH
jgi:acetoacetate decarboxylase